MVSLTGSIASGQQVMAEAAKTLKPIHLELGGKAPVIVFADADLTAVAERSDGGFVNSGQECGAATRIICDRSVRDELTRLLVEQVHQIRVGSPGDGDDVEMGPLVSQAHLDRVTAMVGRARPAGATVPRPDRPATATATSTRPPLSPTPPRGSRDHHPGDLRTGGHRRDVHGRRTRPSSSPTARVTGWPHRSGPRASAGPCGSPGLWTSAQYG